MATCTANTTKYGIALLRLFLASIDVPYYPKNRYHILIQFSYRLLLSL